MLYFSIIFMTFCAALVYGENAMWLLICLLVVHFFSAIITIVVLWDITSTQYVLMKIEPETDIISKSEQLKKRCVLYACRVALVIIAVAVGFGLQLVFFSGAVFALSGQFSHVFFLIKCENYILTILFDLFMLMCLESAVQKKMCVVPVIIELIRQLDFPC